MDDIAMHSDVTNEDRAAWAWEAVDTFRRITQTDEDSAMADLLADMMHLADKQGYDWSALLASGEMHYEAEREDDPEDDTTYTVVRVMELES